MSIGFFDPRFGQYGNEHTDLSIRAVRSGYGGIIREPDGLLFYCINTGLDLNGSTSNGTSSDLEIAGKVWREVGPDQIYRHAWRNDDERAEFLNEISMIS